MNDTQKVILEIFREIKTLCEQNDIPYFAIGGTCIGAVRHHGFIPWDDDLDIAIPIEEYDRFLELAKTGLPDHLKVYTCDDVRHYRYIFAKIMDRRTTFIEKKDFPYPDAYKGIYVDVMPISGVPTSPSERKRFLRKIHWYTTLNTKLRFPIGEFPTWQAKALYLAVFPFRILHDYALFSSRYLKLLRQHPFGTADETGYVWSLSIDRLIFPKQWFAARDSLPFENTSMACPKEWDLYLTKQFQNYMSLPPAGQRAGHHDGIVDFKKSYLEYQRKGL